MAFPVMANVVRRQLREVSDSEIKLLDTLKDMVPEEEVQKFELRTVEMIVYVGDHRLGLHSLDGTNLVIECAKLGAQVREKLMQNQLDEPTSSDMDVEEDRSTTGDAIEPVSTDEISDDPGMLEDARPETIPSYVQSTTFTVLNSDLNEERRRDLEQRFPGSIIQEALPESGPDTFGKRQAAPGHSFEKPHGVKTAIFELETTIDPVMEAQLRQQYPWATVKADVPVGKVSLRDKAAGVGEIETHLQNVATFMTGYPTDNEFDVVLDQSRPWNTLSFMEKLRVAHARAIQRGRCGETLNRNRSCTNCKKHQYTCRVYRRPFADKVAITGHIDLATGCQHCRLLNKSCDLACPSNPTVAAKNAHSSKSPAVTRTYSEDFSSNAHVATPQRASGKLDLADRITRESPKADFTVTELTKLSDIQDLSRRLSLNISRPDVLWKIYNTWKISSSVIPFNPKQMFLQHYYTNLVDWYIMALAISNTKMQYAMLLQFQVTLFEHRDTLPDIDTVVMRAFKYLPVQSSLCQWITTVFCYEWKTGSSGTNTGFPQEHESFDPAIFNKFLYEVACARSRLALGGSKEVLRHWCRVHNHTIGSEEDLRCMEEVKRCENMLSVPQNTLAKKSSGDLASRMTKMSSEEVQRFENMLSKSQNTPAKKRPGDLMSRMTKASSADTLAYTNSKRFKGDYKPHFGR